MKQLFHGLLLADPLNVDVPEVPQPCPEQNQNQSAPEKEVSRYSHHITLWCEYDQSLH